MKCAFPSGGEVEIELSSAGRHSQFLGAEPRRQSRHDPRHGEPHPRCAPHAAGIYRGQCAEYCGGPHAMMAFHVVALEPTQFEEWLAAPAPARGAGTVPDKPARTLFFSTGCNGCHTVRGTRAAGMIGPDLTHVGGRLSLAAATLPNTRRTPSAAGSATTSTSNPTIACRPSASCRTRELAALAAYLEVLQ